jgi:hypothetical protein
VVVGEGTAPNIELLALVTGEQEALGERDRRGPVSVGGADPELADRLMMRVPLGRVANRAVAEKRSECFEQVPITLGDGDAEDKAQSLGSVT